MKLTWLGVATNVAVIAGLAGACGDSAPLPPSSTPTGVGGSAGTPPPVTGAAGSSVVNPPVTGAAGSPVVAPPAPGVAGGTAPVPVAGSGGTVTQLPEGSQIPCEVSRALESGCQSCHGATLQFGAPMSLVTYSDLMKASKTPSMNVAQAALARMNNAASPMPPTSQPMVDGDRKVLSDWLSAGAKPATEAELKCTSGPRPQSRVPHDAAYFKNGLTPKPDEQCYEFPVHGGVGETDRTPYPVRTGEHYQQFYFKVPWKPDTVMTRFGTKFDNVASVHHWLFFTTNRPESQAGRSETVVGTTIGEDSALLAGWAVGGDHVEFPAETGLELPPGGMINVQWHYYNQGATPTTDSSIVQICTKPKSVVRNVASLTFLGTEFFNGPFGMPAMTESKFSGTCINDSGAPIYIYGFNPHMHKLGRHMKATVKRAAGGAEETVFDMPFSFESQITYILDDLVVLQPGDAITSTCTFNNDTPRAVPFGESTNSEMCYNFTMSYPARALDNGTPSLIGATNVCW